MASLLRSIRLLENRNGVLVLPGRSDGELTVSAGEELVIIEDDGSGWTLVARGAEEGYVPTSYVEKL